MGDKGKKQLLLRITDSLWKDLAVWAEDDFRSINGQIEYLLTECVKKRKKTQKTVNETIENEPETLDILED